MVITMSEQQLCCQIIFGEEYVSDSEQCGKFFLVIIKFLKCFLELGRIYDAQRIMGIACHEHKHN